MNKKIIMIGYKYGKQEEKTLDKKFLPLDKLGEWPSGTWFQDRLRRVREVYYYQNLNSNLIKEGDNNGK